MGWHQHKVGGLSSLCCPLLLHCVEQFHQSAKNSNGVTTSDTFMWLFFKFQLVFGESFSLPKLLLCFWSTVPLTISWASIQVPAQTRSFAMSSLPLHTALIRAVSPNREVKSKQMSALLIVLQSRGRKIIVSSVVHTVVISYSFSQVHLCFGTD